MCGALRLWCMRTHVRAAPAPCPTAPLPHLVEALHKHLGLPGPALREVKYRESSVGLHMAIMWRGLRGYRRGARAAY